MMEWLSQFHLDYDYLIRPLVVGTLVSLACSIVGCFIILRRLAFLADAIAHAMLAGVVGGYLLMKLMFGTDVAVGAMLLGALLAGIVTVAMVGLVTGVSRIKQDTAIGVMYTGIFAIGAFAISIKSLGQYIQIDIYHFIVGSVVSVGIPELWIAGIVAAIVIAVVMMLYRQLQLTSFDPVMAASIGVPVLAMDYLLTACTSLVVVSGVRIAGVILVVALIITPAASAYLLFDKLNRMIVAAAGIGVACYWGGFFLAKWLGGSPGPAIVLVSTLFFLTTLVFAPQYGLLANWNRRRRTVPQEIKEDVLGSVLRSKQEWVPMQEVLRHVETANPRIRRAIGQLVRQDYLDQKQESLQLTKKGHREARRLLRAHRIWETYLAHMGTPETDLHGRAHKLEHLNDEQTIDYLDDKLGHPLTDPHGSVIPEDFVDFEELDEVRSSLLREGYRAQVVRVARPELEKMFPNGTVVTAGPRSDDGEIWTLVTERGESIKVSHDDADAIFVKLLEFKPKS